MRTTAALRSAGVSPRQIRRLVRDGALRPLLSGVYVSDTAVAALTGAPPGKAGDQAGTAGDLARSAGEWGTAAGRRAGWGRDQQAGAVRAALPAGGRVGKVGDRRVTIPDQPAKARAQAGGQLLRVAAALAVTNSDSVGSHCSAAQVYGLGLIHGQASGLVEVTRSPEERGSRSGRPGILVHAAALPADQVVRCHGVPLTSVARTVIDLARTLSFLQGVAVADSALHSGQTSRRELDAVLASCPRWPGIQRARQVAAFADARAESVLESIGRVAFHQLGLPPPDLQVWVGDEDEVIGRVDFLWRHFRTIAEADGLFKYSSPSRAVAQLDRDARLRAAGYEVVHFTWPEITRVPAQVAASVRAAFQRSGRD